jgi:hypothetical protein
MAVNVWRAKANNKIDRGCVLCGDVEESSPHRCRGSSTKSKAYGPYFWASLCGCFVFMVGFTKILKPLLSKGCIDFYTV